ncbi:MAG TPA: alpha/beta hydrolase [Solirubrobacteraceae bacterium]
MREHSIGGDPALTLLHAADGKHRGRRLPVLFVHGTTFPSELASFYRFDGESWSDALTDAGFDAWALDFAGYGRSARYPEMAGAPDAVPPLGRVPAAATQIGRACGYVREQTGTDRVSIVAHSWGTLAAGRYAASRPEHVEQLVLFGPIARREILAEVPNLPAYRDVTLQEQFDRFVEDVPDGHPPVLEDFDRWAARYLASDPDAHSRELPNVRIPAGPTADILGAWAGYFPYDPGAIRASVLIVRGEWDSLCKESDANWLKERLSAAAEVSNVVIDRATHLMHLEHGRHELHAVCTEFLNRAEAARAPSRIAHQAR